MIEPGAVLLTAAGETMQLEAVVLDAAGKPVQATVAWQSSDPGTVSVTAGGLATATAGLGSAQITAVAQGLSSEPALALVARPTSGVVLVPDSRIVTDPVGVDPDAEYGPGWRYRILVTGDAPESGRLVIGTGGRSLAGRVVGATAQGAETELTVELVALNQLFADLKIEESIPMVEMETGTSGSSWRALEPDRGPAGFMAADTEFKLGRFECTASGEVPELDLPSPTVKVDPDLSLALGYANGLEKYAVVGSITADFGYKPVFKATFEGRVGCETVVTTATVPLFGPLALFFGIQVPLGVGVELDGKLEIAEVGFDVSAHARATAELGLLCPTTGGTCSSITSFDAQRDFNFEFIAPDPTEQFKLELGGHGYLFAKPAVGNRFSRKAQFEFLAATAGLEQSVDLATPTRQVKEADYASGFRLAGLINVGPGKDLTSAIDKLGDLLGVDLDIDLTLVDIDETLAESPKGTFTITPASVEPGNDMTLGDMATFAVELDPVTYLGIESIDRVEIFWKKVDGSGGFTLEPGRAGCTDIGGSSGQTTFTCQTDFLDEHAGEQTFYAFVHAKLFGLPLPIPLEINNDAADTVQVSGGLVLEAEFPSTIVEGAGVDLRIRAGHGNTGNPTWTPDIQLALTSEGGSVAATTGITDAEGYFTTMAQLDEGSTKITIVIDATDGTRSVSRTVVATAEPAKHVELLNTYLQAQAYGGRDAPCRQEDLQESHDPREYQPLESGSLSVSVTIDCSTLEGQSAATGSFQVTRDPTTGWVRRISGTATVSANWARKVEWEQAGPVGSIDFVFVFRFHESVRVRGAITCSVNTEQSGRGTVYLPLKHSEVTGEDCPNRQLSDSYTVTDGLLIARTAANSNYFFGPASGSASVQFDFWLEFY